MTKRRALGQHFLRDAGIARAIVDLVAPSAQDLVVEIGPGEGALTGELAGRAGRVVALEIDRGLVARLRARIPSVEVVEADARAWDYGALARPPGGRALVVGNLPYSVGKPILAALIVIPIGLPSWRAGVAWIPFLSRSPRMPAPSTVVPRATTQNSSPP